MTFRKLFSILVVFSLLVGMVPSGVQAAEGNSEGACSVWDGSVDTSWYREEELEFTICTAAQFAGVAALVNEGHDFSGKTITLAADISLNKLAWTSIGKSIPYSGQYNTFSGVFDGAGHTVTELYVDENSDCNGLFGNVNGTIMNLHLAQSTIYITRKAKSQVGGFVSILHQGGQIYGCTSDVSITLGKGTVAGGIVGLSVGSIVNCVNYGSIYGWTFDALGGIVGEATGRIEDCMNYGTVQVGSASHSAGGIAGSCGFNSMNGYADIEIQNCRNYGTVFRTVSDSFYDAYLGGIAGKLNAQEGHFCRINACLNAGKIRCQVNLAGGIVGMFSSGNGSNAAITNCCNTGAVLGTGEYSKKIGGIAGNSYGAGSSIENCYSLGNCEGYYDCGAIVGLNGYPYPEDSTDITCIINCYYLQGSASFGVGRNRTDGIQENPQVETRAYTAGQMQSSLFCHNLNTTNGSMPSSNAWSYSPDQNNGYPFLTSVSGLNTSSDVNGVNPEVSKLYITGFSRRELVMDGVQDKAIAVFSQNIVKGDTDRGIAFWDADTGQMVTLLPIENENIRASANCLTIDVGALDIPGGRTYYITIPPGAVESTNGDIFYGLEDKNSWVVTIPQDLSVDGVTMAWAQNGWFPLFKENDYTKPPIPAGSDREYGALLSDWAWNCGYSLSESEAQALLDEPVYLPVTSDGKSFLLDDKATTVRQVMEDIIFTANLQPYLEDLDNLLAETENSTGADSGWGQIAEILSGETEAYELAASWYDQVDRYMTGRASESNFFLSLAAPIAYKLLMDKVTSGQIGPVAKAQLALVENEYALSTIGGMETYAQFKEAVKDVGTAGQGLSAAYTAYVDGNPKNLVRFGFDLLEEHWTETGNGMLTELVGAYQEISSAKSAVQLCMFLGSSIGYFPMVVDLYQDLNNSRYNQVKTAYFLADYYVAEKDPDLYDTILGLDDGMLHSSTYVWNNFSSEDALNYELALDRGERSSDPVIANWARFINTGGMVDLDGADIAMLRRDITNYATILRYAKSIDTTSTIEALVGYLKTEAAQGNRTAVAVSCPVVVNIYDADNQLVASLSSEHEEIADNRFGTLYLLGENGETKYFYLNSADYRAEIVPYDAGTMDVTITQMSAEGNADSVYYEDVQLSPDMVISTDIWISEDSALTVTGSSGTIKPESEIPVSFLEVNGPEEVAVGSSAVLTAVVGPVAATSKTVTWNSSEPSILSVTPDGTVSALAEGSAVITCTTNSGITASMAISTYLPATSLTCDTEAVSMLVGESCPLSVTVEGGAGRPISWRSSNASVISVDQSGTINALSAGTAVVTAEADGLTVDIRVTAGLAPLAVSLYQSDMGEMQLKMDLTNLSLEQNFAETIYLALYHGAKMEGLISIPSGLAPGETRTVYYPLTALSEGGTYSVSAFILDGDCVPYQIKTTQTLIP